MKASMVENRGDAKIAYDSLIVAPKKLSVFNSDLALRIVNELARNPGCAMDLARSLKEHEQKIYYHLRRLENVGIVKPIGTEKRYGMTAKIFSMTCPVIATKLYEDGRPLKKTATAKDPNTMKFFYPFIEDGKLNAMIIIGDTYSHGRFDSESTEGPYTFELGILLGNLLSNLKFPHYKFDTEVTKEDLKENLIVIGNIKTNILVDKLNGHLPVYFDEENKFYITSKKTGAFYDDARVGIITKIRSPFEKNKKVLLLGGRGRRGTQAAILACTKHFQKIAKNLNEDGDAVIVVKGFDRDGDKVIDDIVVLE